MCHFNISKWCSESQAVPQCNTNTCITSTGHFPSIQGKCMYYIKIHIGDHIFYLADPNLIWQVTPWPVFGITLKMFRKNLPLYFVYLEQSSWTLWRAHLQNVYNSLHFLYFMLYLSFSSKTCSTDYAYHKLYHNSPIFIL